MSRPITCIIALFFCWSCGASGPICGRRRSRQIQHRHAPSVVVRQSQEGRTLRRRFYLELERQGAGRCRVRCQRRSRPRRSTPYRVRANPVGTKLAYALDLTAAGRRLTSMAINDDNRNIAADDKRPIFAVLPG